MDVSRRIHHFFLQPPSEKPPSAIDHALPCPSLTAPCPSPSPIVPCPYPSPVAPCPYPSTAQAPGPVAHVPIAGRALSVPWHLGGRHRSHRSFLVRPARGWPRLDNGGLVVCYSDRRRP